MRSTTRSASGCPSSRARPWSAARLAGRRRVPAERPITVADLLTFRAGYGFPSDFSLPAVQPLLAPCGADAHAALGYLAGRLARRAGADPDAAPARASLALQHLRRHPRRARSRGSRATVARSSSPSGVRAARHGRHRLLGAAASSGGWRATTPEPSGGFSPVEPPDRGWATEPAFASGAAGSLSTADDWHAFGRMLLAGGTVDGRRSSRRSRSGR